MCMIDNLTTKKEVEGEKTNGETKQRNYMGVGEIWPASRANLAGE